MISWKNDGAEPIYVCAEHAKELGYSVDVGVNASNVPGQAGATMQKEAPAAAGPIAGPKKPASASSRLENETLAIHRDPTKPVLSAAERYAVINRQISEYAAQLEHILAQSEATISAADTIDAALEQATLEIIGNHAMTEIQKDSTIQQLGELQESLKQDAGQGMTLPKAHRIKQAVADLLSGNVGVADEGKLPYRGVYDRLENAIHAEAPAAKHIEERLAELFKSKAELENLHARELEPAVA